MAAIFYLDWRVAVAFLLVSPLALFLPVYFNKKIEVKDKKWVESSQGIFLRVQEIFSNIRLLKLFNTYDQHTEERVFDLRRSFDLFLDKLRLELRLHIAALTLNKLFAGVFVLYCGYGLFAKSLSLGTLSAILLYLGQIFQIHNSFLGFLYGLPQFLVSSKRLEHITNVQFVSSPGIINPDLKAQGGNISFDKVSFKYKDRGHLLLRVSFGIESGSLVGLVGFSGCGKTTIINLMLGVLAPEEGQVCIDGVNVSDLDQAFLRKHIAVAPQEIFLWNSSIAQNISYGLEGVSLVKIKDAAKIARIDDFIESLEKGYDTIIGEDACRLSEGQKQRIAITRAVIRKPQILFLDEATAHLDAKNEKGIFDNLRRDLPRATIIFVSHNRALLEKADKICFVHGRDLVELGSHNELLARHKDYAVAVGPVF
jgi:ABC-type multidrug transport system fused ATPase/permease subunit